MPQNPYVHAQKALATSVSEPLDPSTMLVCLSVLKSSTDTLSQP